MALFSLVMSLLIVLAYQNQTNRLNRATLSANLTHLLPRIEDVRREWSDDADHLLDVTEWAGLLNLPEPVRSAKLQAFFTAQAESMGFEGIAITDDANGELLFDFWNNSEKPELQKAITVNEPLWFDDEHLLLFTKIQKNSRGLGHTFHIFFFKT